MLWNGGQRTFDHIYLKRYIAKQQNDVWNKYKLDATVSGFTTKQQ